MYACFLTCQYAQGNAKLIDERLWFAAAVNAHSPAIMMVEWSRQHQWSTRSRSTGTSTRRRSAVRRAGCTGSRSPAGPGRLSGSRRRAEPSGAARRRRWRPSCCSMTRAPARGWPRSSRPGPRPPAPRSANRELSALRSAGGWWREQGWIQADPTAGLRLRHPAIPRDITHRAAGRCPVPAAGQPAGARVVASAARLGRARGASARPGRGPTGPDAAPGPAPDLR